MRKFLTISLLLAQLVVLFIFITPREVSSSWAKMSIEELLRSSDLIIIGKLISLRPYPSSLFEIGTIEVKEVIVGSKALKEALLIIPARDSKIRLSTDIMYTVGQEGLWFLRLKAGSKQELNDIFYLADHPQRFQPAENVELVRKYLRTNPS